MDKYITITYEDVKSDFHKYKDMICNKGRIVGYDIDGDRDRYVLVDMGDCKGYNGYMRVQIDNPDYKEMPTKKDEIIHHLDELKRLLLEDE